MSRIDELKKISIIGWLESKGHQAKKETGSKVWFLSPSHPENNPSFCVFKADNTYKDYSTTTPRGDILDLVREIEHCDLATAMNILSDNKDVSKYEPIEVSSEPLITVSHVYDSFISPDLILYLKSRKIPKEIYSKYCKEAHYWFKDNPDKTYRAVGFCNDSGGWELRSPIHKYCCSPKDITTITNDGGVLNIYEGFINFFSSLVYFGVDRMEGTTIVLNGLGMAYKILDTLNQYQIVNCFFDWGVGGNATTDLIRSRVGSDRCFDHRYIYPEPMDFNDLIVEMNK